ncbi:MAG: MBL fold metallo-hydrolase [Chloroflexi bacterium]|nr:MAG: MBL fold metallo-hydrolase [Chloroflexota bacterium]
MTNKHTIPKRIELPTGMAVGNVNAYLFTAPEPILIDCGIRVDGAWEVLENGLAEHGIAVSDLSRVIITHPHVDHYGLAGRIVAGSDAEVWISDIGAPWLLSTKEMWQQRLEFYHDQFLIHLGYSPQAIEEMIAGIHHVSTQIHEIPSASVVTFQVDGILQLGGLAWQILHTPGHSYRQTCFYQSETRQLLSADHILAKTPTPVVEQSPQTNQRLQALPQFLRSLDLVEQLDVDMVYPGHGRPFSNLHEIIQRQRTRIDERKAECLSLIQDGKHKIPELLDIMYAHYPVQYRSIGLWMVVGYLDLLQSESKVVERTVDDIWHYYPC